ncbi:MAG: phosphopantetheine adenylyltransferase [Myxococcota bacterium]
MQVVWTLLVLVATAINLAPVLGAVAPERMTALYGVNLEDPNLQILMRHRAVLFGIVGGLLLAAAFRPRLRTVGYVVGFSSMLSFLLIAWLVGGYGAEIRRVVLIDVVGIAALAGAGLVQAFWLRTAAADPRSVGRTEAGRV